MPVVRVDWLDGRDPAQKTALIAAMTDVMHQITGVADEHINVILNDVPVGNWARAGAALGPPKAPSGGGDAVPPVVGSVAASVAAERAWTTPAGLPLLDRPTRVIDLEQPRVQGMPVHENHQPGYLYVLHRRHADAAVTGPPGRRSSASGLIVCMEHSGTHIDAIAHQADGQMLYGGVPADEVSHAKGFNTHAVEEIPPIVARGVLLDVARRRGVDSLGPSEAIGAAELQACAADLGVAIEPGDVVLVRTGNGRYWSQPDRYLAGPGVDADASAWLAERRVMAVGADNMAWDVIGRFDEVLDVYLPGHLILLAQSGVYIIENLDLEGLAATEAATFTFICAPLKFVGATGSPVRPLALLPA